MKYFKPDLLVRCRSLDDDAADEAAADWEKAIVAYRKRLQTIRRRLPVDARRLITHYALHDAKIRSIAKTLTVADGGRRRSLSIRVQVEDTPSQAGDVLELNYALAAGSHSLSFKKTSLFEGGASGFGRILYAEFDWDSQRRVWTHSLLLSSGWELDVRFGAFRLRRLEEISLSPSEMPAGKDSQRLVQA